MPRRGAAVAARRAPRVPAHRPALVVACSMMVIGLAAACNGAPPPGPGASPGTVTLVNRVTATVRGLTCANCGAVLEAALGRGLDPATITVAAARDRVDVDFERSASPFSSASFRRTVAGVGGQVLSLQIEACGAIDTAGVEAWLTSGSTRLRLEGAGPLPTGTELCVTGELRDEESPARLIIRRLGS